MSAATETVPAWPAFSGDFGALNGLWDEVCAKPIRRSAPQSLGLVLSIMDMSELMGRPLVLMRGGWKRVRQ